ncbi:MAG: hypothetical protein AB1523_09005 [Bacillota bacterium]
MLTCNALLTASFGKPVISAVTNLECRDYRHHLPQEYAVSFDGQAVNTFTYQTIKLWDYRVVNCHQATWCMVASSTISMPICPEPLIRGTY